MLWFVLIVALMIPLVAIVLDSSLIRAVVNRLERPDTGADPALLRRVQQLEGEIERLNGEVLRLEEETTFLHRLLENKPANTGELPPG